MAFEINEKEGSISVRIDPKLYNLNVVYSACYVMLDRVYVLLDGNPEKEIIVNIRPKLEQNEKKANIDSDKVDESSLKMLADEFMNHLIAQGFYHFQNQETMSIRSLILRRILMLDDKNVPVIAKKNSKNEAQELIDLVYGKSPKK